MKMFSTAGNNSHLGKKIAWDKLPETHRKHIIERLKPIE